MCVCVYVRERERERSCSPSVISKESTKRSSNLTRARASYNRQGEREIDREWLGVSGQEMRDRQRQTETDRERGR